MFVKSAFRGLNKNELPAAFLPPCATCQELLAQMHQFFPYTDFRRVSLIETGVYVDLAYYWEWSSREKTFKPCFGTVWGTRRVVGHSLSKVARYKRNVGKKDYERFDRRDWHEPWAALSKHQYEQHFDVAVLDAMLADPSHLPVGVDSWSYWEA